ncbi:MAG: inositol monophosphatase, partial [Ignavibacteria bacterium 13_1_40CM_2_61_4]
MIDTAIEAAREAGKLLKLNLGRVKDIRQKEGQEKNLVTEIDRQSEEVIKQIIGRRHPGHSILAEESGRKGAPESEFTWVIDPLDGTTNYTHAFPVFCVSIAVEQKGRIILGVIYDPNFDELFVAERGKGATLNGKRIRVSGIDSLIRSLLVTGFPYDVAENPGHAIDHFVRFLTRAQAVRRMGSAAIDLAYTAAGRYDGFWEVSLNPWDTAAGALLVEEAGGRVTNFTGGPFDIYQKAILATNG